MNQIVQKTYDNIFLFLITIVIQNKISYQIQSNSLSVICCILQKQHFTNFETREQDIIYNLLHQTIAKVQKHLYLHKTPVCQKIFFCGALIMSKKCSVSTECLITPLEQSDILPQSFSQCIQKLTAGTSQLNTYLNQKNHF